MVNIFYLQGRQQLQADAGLRQRILRSLPAETAQTQRVLLDRLLAALLELKALDLEQATSQVIVTTMDRDHIDEMEAILAATDLPVERNVFLNNARGVGFGMATSGEARRSGAMPAPTAFQPWQTVQRTPYS